MKTMTPLKFEITGEDNIQRHISKMLLQSQKQFEANCQPIAAEMLFTLLEGANYICLDLVKSKQDSYSLTIPVIEALRWFTVAFDPLLNCSAGFIKAPSLESFKAISDRFILLCLAIGEIQYWRRVQDIHNLKPMKSVVVENDKFLDSEEPDFYKALDEIRSNLSPDLNWGRYFAKHIFNPRMEKENILHSQAFNEYYGLEATDFAAMNSYFRTLAKNFDEKVAPLQIPLLQTNRQDIGVSNGFPQAMNIVFGILQGAMPAEGLPRFTPVPLREKVLADLQNEMKCEREKAQKYLEALEYSPAKDVFCHPIIPLIENGKLICAFMPWLFQPMPLCSDQWDRELFAKRPKSSWAKAMGQWYGDGFNDYVAGVLRTLDIDDLIIERYISRAEFGEDLTPRIRRIPDHKDGFKPDIICQKADIAMVISCKAEDLGFDYWLRHNYLFIPGSEIRSTKNKNIAAIREVSFWSQCIASSTSIRQSLGIQAKKIMPMLVNSRKEPLGSPIFRKYIAQTEIFPAVPAVTVEELKQFVMSGFDMSVLPLPYSPQVLIACN